MSDESRRAAPGEPTPRQAELLRIIQGLDPSSRHTLKIVCRGTEPWEVQEIVEHRALGDLRPRRDS